MQCSDAVKSLSLAPLAPTRERGGGEGDTSVLIEFPKLGFG
jgi:hypothetical protein